MSLLKKFLGAGEMTRWLRILPALPENPGSIPSTQMVSQYCRRSKATSGLFIHSTHVVHGHIFRQNTHAL